MLNLRYNHIGVMLDSDAIVHYALELTASKGPVKLFKWVKIAHSFLQVVSDQFHVIILSLPV